MNPFQTKETPLKNSKPSLSYKYCSTPVLFWVLIGKQLIHIISLQGYSSMS